MLNNGPIADLPRGVRLHLGLLPESQLAKIAESPI